MNDQSIRACGLAFLLPVLMILTSCGSITTVAQPEHIVAKNLREEGSSCTSLPRVYSGVVYCACRMMGDPAPIHTWQSTDKEAYRWLLDMAASTVVDTLLLPYTATLQSQEGNIRLR